MAEDIAQLLDAAALPDGGEDPREPDSPLALPAHLEAIGRHLCTLADDERGRAEYQRIWDSLPWDDRAPVTAFADYWSKVQASPEAIRQQKIAERREQLAVNREATRQDRREQLKTLGETGWTFPDLREAYAALGGERQQPDIGHWNRMLSKEDALLHGDAEGDGHGVLYSRKVNMIFGPSESGKSMFSFAITAQEITDGKHVVIIDYEDDQYGLVARLTDLGLDIEEIVPGGTKPGGVYYIPARLGMEEDDFALVRERIEAHAGTDHPVSMILIDAVTEGMSADGLNPDKAAEVAQWAGALPKRLAALGPGVAIIDHTNHDQNDRAGGSQHKKSMIDGVSLRVSRKESFIPGKGGCAHISVAKDRIGSIREQSKPGKTGEMEYRGAFVMKAAGEEEPFAMVGRHPGELDRVPDDEQGGEGTGGGEQLSDLAEEIVHIVRENPGIGKHALAQRIEQKAANAAKYAAVDEALRTGLIRAEKGFRGKVEHHPAIPPEGVQEPLLTSPDHEKNG